MHKRCILSGTQAFSLRVCTWSGRLGTLGDHTSASKSLWLACRAAVAGWSSPCALRRARGERLKSEPSLLVHSHSRSSSLLSNVGFTNCALAIPDLAFPIPGSTVPLRSAMTCIGCCFSRAAVKIVVACLAMGHREVAGFSYHRSLGSFAYPGVGQTYKPVTLIGPRLTDDAIHTLLLDVLSGHSLVVEGDCYIEMLLQSFRTEPICHPILYAAPLAIDSEETKHSGTRSGELRVSDVVFANIKKLSHCWA